MQPYFDQTRKTTSEKKMEDDLEKNKNGRRPQIKIKNGRRQKKKKKKVRRQKKIKKMEYNLKKNGRRTNQTKST